MQCNFYITETGTHKQKLFYFRHDIWSRMTSPTIKKIKSNVTGSEIKRNNVPSDRSIYSKKIVKESVNKTLTPTLHVLSMLKVN
ncbi:hypothetical protein AYI70_g11869 [Smittium culicis]|uniref:Telomerase ribonucleoprotein complex - RNA-binding domain-containing protein n=1 Tax=Smittium culicis TaxID=133412 RepID=A0A1R1WZY5_9FUNG|nr:hypothetical protein AYI70_g11869 [Smittium culicis]